MYFFYIIYQRSNFIEQIFQLFGSNKVQDKKKKNEQVESEKKQLFRVRFSSEICLRRRFCNEHVILIFGGLIYLICV